MPKKYDYKTFDEVPENVKHFYYTNSGWETSNGVVVTVADINEFLNDLNSWYELHQQSLEDFL